MTTSSGSHHRDRALRHLEASLAARDALSDLFATGRPVDRARIAHLHDEVRLGVKLAQVNALLAIEERMANLTTPTDALDALGLERVAAGGRS